MSLSTESIGFKTRQEQKWGRPTT